MGVFTIGLWVVVVSLFVLSLIKDKKKTLGSMKKAKGMMKNMGGQILAILLLIGLLETFIPPEIIGNLLGEANEVLSTAVMAIVGSITLIPGIIAFPLVGSFVDAGASIVPAVAFITTLTMVGIVTFSLEKKEFGLKFALTRNLLGFVFAIVIALVMGVIL